MAKLGAKYIQLSKEQKDEVRKLTQQANRRIKAFAQEYDKYGLDIIPAEVSMGIQVKEQWASDKYALSRSTKFETVHEYREHLKQLKKYAEGSKGGIPTLTEYTSIQQQKLIDAIETITKEELSEEMLKNISSMSAGQLVKFWDEFERRAVRLAGKFSSDQIAVMAEELFSEDLQNVPRKAIQVVKSKKKG